MGFYQDQIVPLLINWSMRQKNLAAYRSRIVAAAEGRVLEIGIGSGLNLPFYSRNVSHVATWTLCSIPDAARALHDMRRVLRPGGHLLFVEHGRAPDPNVVWWQDRMIPVTSWNCSHYYSTQRSISGIGGAALVWRGGALARKLPMKYSKHKANRLYRQSRRVN